MALLSGLSAEQNVIMRCLRVWLLCVGLVVAGCNSRDTDSSPDSAVGSTSTQVDGDSTTSEAGPVDGSTSTTPVGSTGSTVPLAESAVRVIDERSRNPAEWLVAGFEWFPDAFVPLDVAWDSDGRPVFVYWVGLEAHPDFGALPSEQADALGWGSVRLARCADPVCRSGFDVSDDAVSLMWPGPVVGAINIDIAGDGSLVMVAGEMFVPYSQWSASQFGPPAGRQLFVVCDDSLCGSAVERPFEEVITGPLSDHDHPAVKVNGSGSVVLAYRTGPVEQEVLHLAVCAEPSCAELATITVIDQEVIGYQLMVDPQGRPAVVYSRWGENTNRYVACTDSSCSALTDPVVLTEQPGFLRPLSVGDRTRFWFQPYDPSDPQWPSKPVDDQVIECLEMTCANKSVTPVLSRAPVVPTNAVFAEEICGKPVSVGPSGELVLSWCDLESGTRQVLVCDDIDCTDSSLVTVPESANGIVGFVMFDPDGAPRLVTGGTRGLRITALGHFASQDTESGPLRIEEGPNMAIGEKCTDPAGDIIGLRDDPIAASAADLISVEVDITPTEIVVTYQLAIDDDDDLTAAAERLPAGSENYTIWLERSDGTLAATLEGFASGGWLYTSGIGRVYLDMHSHPDWFDGIVETTNGATLKQRWSLDKLNTYLEGSDLDPVTGQAKWFATVGSGMGGATWYDRCPNDQ